MKVLGCRKVLRKDRTCGDISFANKIILCEDCRKKMDVEIKKAKRKKWEAEREHCEDCEAGNYCATCKPEFDKLNETIEIGKVLDND